MFFFFLIFHCFGKLESGQEMSKWWRLRALTRNIVSAKMETRLVVEMFLFWLLSTKGPLNTYSFQLKGFLYMHIFWRKNYLPLQKMHVIIWYKWESKCEIELQLLWGVRSSAQGSCDWRVTSLQQNGVWIVFVFTIFMFGSEKNSTFTNTESLKIRVWSPEHFRKEWQVVVLWAGGFIRLPTGFMKAWQTTTVVPLMRTVTATRYCECNLYIKGEHKAVFVMEGGSVAARCVWRCRLLCVPGQK